MISIKCRYDSLIPIEDIVPHPDNENKHKENQIRILAKIIKKDGVRHPITVSKLSGKIAMGHGRLLAFKLLEMTEVPIEFQDFDDPIQEMRVRNSDNNIARYAEISQENFHDNLKSLGVSIHDIDIEDYGVIEIEVMQPDLGDDFSDDEESSKNKDEKLCPHCGLVI